MTAVIRALETFDTKNEINLYTDSKYVIEGINSWIHGWKKNKWKNSQRKAKTMQGCTQMCLTKKCLYQ